MANNIDAGLNFVTATQDATWAAVGFNTGNTLEIYATVGGAPVSWRPNKLLNTLTGPGIVEGKGYMINSKTSRDLTAFFGAANGGAVLLSSIITPIP